MSPTLFHYSGYAAITEWVRKSSKYGHADTKILTKEDWHR